jgi:hypothetical protein
MVSLLPSRISLGPGYPNPATSQLTIPFSLPEYDDIYNISLVIYDLLGNEIKTLMTSRMTCGFHEIIWKLDDNSGNTVRSGVYVVQIHVTANGLKKHLISKIILR